jgi:hypothetical protein
MLRLGPRPWWIQVECNIHDAWLGVYWCWKAACYATAYGLVMQELHLYICVLPCVPVHLVFGRHAPRPDTLEDEDYGHVYGHR